MSIREIVKNDLVQEESSVWVLADHSEFGYSDGVDSERYLEYVFKNAKDLTSGSRDLEKHIKDWPSEYHLSAKRAQLFAGFDFDRSLRVLEVGCGCGAITRYLGETFDDVVSIEGSLARARLARLRTMGLGSVSIICAPFQEIKFSGKFDIIFCVGVFEYSASFVSGENPYDSVLSYFSELLTANGVVVIAIENQFGLKYLNSSREDHTATLFEGLEGYHVHGNRVRTFGKKELEDRLKEYFSSVEMFYPYPDYKLPTCIISDDFLSSSDVGELVSQIRSRDYCGELEKQWDESLVSLELSRNGMLPFFSNSFLAFAKKTDTKRVPFDHLAVMVSSQRTEKFRTQTRIYLDSSGSRVVEKQPLSGESRETIGNLSLVESRAGWIDSYSLHTILHRNCLSKVSQFEDVFAPCEAWVQFLMNSSTCSGGEQYIQGEYIDCNFSNAYMDKGEIVLIDKEWIWKEPIRVNVIVLRAIFVFLSRVRSMGRPPGILRVRSMRKLIVRIAENIGVSLGNDDFTEFVWLESEFQSLVQGTGAKRNSILLRWALFDAPSLAACRILKMKAIRIKAHILRVLVRLRT